MQNSLYLQLSQLSWAWLKSSDRLHIFLPIILDFTEGSTMLPSISHVVGAVPFRHVSSTQNVLRAAISTTVVNSRSTFSTVTAAQKHKSVTLLQDKDNGFGFARSNPRPPKPRTKGVTEIRGPYYTVWSWREHLNPLSLLTTDYLGHGETLPSRRSWNVRTLILAWNRVVLTRMFGL
jgi:hypothetical protein